MPKSPLTLGVETPTSVVTLTPCLVASISIIGRISSKRRHHPHGLKPEVLRSGELQESLDDLIQPADFALDDFDVLERSLDGRRERGRTRGPKAERPTGRSHRFGLKRGGNAAANLRSQQLEVNHHRVQRILHLVRDACRQTAERHELA